MRTEEEEEGTGEEEVEVEVTVVAVVADVRRRSGCTIHMVSTGLDSAERYYLHDSYGEALFAWRDLDWHGCYEQDKVALKASKHSSTCQFTGFHHVLQGITPP